MSSSEQIPMPSELAAFIRARTGKSLNPDDLRPKWTEALREWRIYRRRIEDAWAAADPDARCFTFAELQKDLGVSEKTLREYWRACFGENRLMDEDELALTEAQLARKRAREFRALKFDPFMVAVLRKEQERQKKAKGTPGGKAAAAKRLKRSGKKR